MAEPESGVAKEGDKAEQPKEQPAISFAEFLEKRPPSHEVTVKDTVYTKKNNYNVPERFISTPELTLYCTHTRCGGLRMHRFKEGSVQINFDDKRKPTYLWYLCSNCSENLKLFSIQVIPEPPPSTQGKCYKFGEQPPFGPPTPPRLLRMFGKDKEIFLKGRQCENQGLGIGSFVYYRRVVENQKDQILTEIIKVAETVKAPQEMIADLKTAKNEQQFSKALESIKHGIPESLLLDGHNPIALLHAALSGGLHNKSDQECLELAQAVRVVLAELSERLGAALKDHAELNTALSKLMKARQTK